MDLPAAHVVFDNGATRDVYLLPQSNAPAVVAVGRGERGYIVSGVGEGEATVTARFQNVPVILAIRVGR